MNYTVYHLHSDYSLLDSCTDYKEYIDKASELGMKAIAFSEHGKLSGWVKKKQYCDEKGIKYIHAVEIYLTERLEPKTRDNYHTVLIARNDAGRKELNELVSKSFDKEHFYYANRISFDEFLSMSKNIISTSACLASPLNKLDVSHEKYEQLIRKYDFLEIQAHNHPDQIAYNQHLAIMAEKYGKKLIAGTDTHSLDKYKAECRKILLKRKDKSYGDEDSFDLTFKSYEELVDAFRVQNALPESIYLQAIANTNLLIDMVEDFSLDTTAKYPILYGSREKDHDALVSTVDRKFKEKIESGAIPQDQIESYKTAIEEEMRVFTKTHMDGFMLSMSEFISWCHDNNISTGFARGSVGGSRVAYVTDIVDMNPETWKTIFSRFCNEDRVELGDIDTDVIDSDRPKIFQYMKDRFSVQKTARVSSFGTIAEKGVIDDVGGALRKYWDESHPDEEANNPYSLKNIDKIKAEYEADPDDAKSKHKELFYYFDGLLGTKVSQSVHPAGMIVSPITLQDNYGVFDKDDDLCLFLDMDECHDVGLVKYDFLILGNVEIVRNCYELLGKKYPKSHEINWNDEAVWNDMLRSPVGIFQFESNYAFDMLCRYKPKSIFDMALLTACARPSGASYRDDLIAHKTHHNPSKLIDDILKDNNGYLVFQEDVIKFLQEACGLSGSQADTVRRGIAKKNIEMLSREMPKIIDGYCSKSTSPREVAEKEANEFIKIIEDASSYMFNYNHSIAYCLLGYLCAYLRYYHTAEFITSYLNCAANDDDIKNGTALAELYNIKIIPPKYGFSKGSYAYDKENNTISKGISSIKYMSDSVANDLYDVAHSVKPKTFAELLIALRDKKVDSRQLNILTAIGFFDDFGNIAEITRIRSMYDFFTKQKKYVSKIKKESVAKNEYLKRIIEKHSTGTTKSGADSASYSFTSENDVIATILECEQMIKALNIPDVDIKTKIQNKIDYLGYCDIQTGKPEDRRKLIVNSMTPLKSKTDGSIWAYRFDTRSVGTGKTCTLTVQSKVYNINPFVKGSVLNAINVYKNNAGYWYLGAYEIIQ